MKEFSKDELKKFYQNRKEKLFNFMEENNISAVVFEDSEENRDSSVRYFTGHPGDALFIASKNKKCALVAWDENLAKQMSVDVPIFSYNDYKRQNIAAVKEILKSFKIDDKRKKVEISPKTPYPQFLKFVDALENYDVLCRENSAHDFVTEICSCKDEYEIECTKEACRVGDLIIEKIEEQIKNGSIKTESDVALLIEKELRANGCEKTGFDTLAAGPKRSFAIHAFPGYTDDAWPSDGLSILDFGVVYNGYTSDTTLTVVKNPTKEQKHLVELVETAAKQALPYYKNGEEIRLAAIVAQDVFKKAKKVMPHTLGHGIGLKIHEFPRVSENMSKNQTFKTGMIVTLEPGLYDSEIGGVRLENDILITENGNEVLTKSKIIYC